MLEDRFDCINACTAACADSNTVKLDGRGSSYAKDSVGYYFIRNKAVNTIIIFPFKEKLSAPYTVPKEKS